ncbi:lipocalin family protein [Hymenobacter sp. AT01-02]|uniref:lipocalin family protein n=1 Tax=Hymenobacter sp. AT01-02 TaxID=1571877 RepID=UPI000A63BC23|nr:lipocalin family protein [Hymenobacter sp. AT01-02]
MPTRTRLFATCLLLGVFTSLSSCQKESTPLTVRERLMARTWRVTGGTEQEGSAPVQDSYASASPCFLDNLYTFNADQSIVLDEGPTKCDPLADQAYTGTWTLSENDQVLEANIPQRAVPPVSAVNYRIFGTIEELTETTLIVTWRFTSPTSGLPNVRRIIYTGQ